jgi:ABC-type enterobactin transport system permease subunit
MESRGRSAGRGRHRTQAERDAVTVEIGYALCSAAFAAALAFGAVAGPAFAFDLSGSTRRWLVTSGATTAAVLFVARVVSVLVRFPRGARDQPGRPGRSDPGS